MDGSKEPAATAGRGADEPVARAEQLFSSLTQQADHRRGGARSEAAPAPAAGVPGPAVQPNGQSTAQPRPRTDQEVVRLVRGSLAATGRLTEALDFIGRKQDASAADLAALGEIVEEVLEAIHERLAAIEGVLQVEGSLGQEPAKRFELAMRQLRVTLRGSARRRRPGPDTPKS